MVTAGLSAEKAHGSAWNFYPKSRKTGGMGVERSIQFHEPHPSVKFPFRGGEEIWAEVGEGVWVDGGDVLCGVMSGSCGLGS